MNTILAMALITILVVVLLFAIDCMYDMHKENAKLNMELTKTKTMLNAAYAISDDATKKILDEIESK